MALSVAGCETTKTVDTYCFRAGLIYWHKEDTPKTKEQVAAHNETFESSCFNADTAQ